MCQKAQKTADSVTFTEEILNGKLHFFVQYFFKSFVDRALFVYVTGIKREVSPPHRNPNFHVCYMTLKHGPVIPLYNTRHLRTWFVYTQQIRNRFQRESYDNFHYIVCNVISEGTSSN